MKNNSTNSLIIYVLASIFIFFLTLIFTDVVKPSVPLLIGVLILTVTISFIIYSKMNSLSLIIKAFDSIKEIIDEDGRGAQEDIYSVKIQEKIKSYVNRISELEDVRSQFIGDISHELKTPVFLLKGYVETLELQDLDENMKEDFLSKIKVQTTKIENILEDLIHISMIESKDIRLQKEAVEFQDVVDELYMIFAPIIEKRGDQFSIPEETKEIVFIDKDKLIIAMSNLINNAIFYSESGNILLTVKNNAHNCIQVGITDHGIGIPKEEQRKIFQRFYRVESSRSKNTGGTGLGLAIVKHILQAHGFDYSVKSDLGIGTTFYFDMPIYKS